MIIFMKEFFDGAITICTTGLTAIVVFPLVPLWTFSIWFTHDDSDVFDAAADAFEAYLKVIRIE